MFVTRHCVTGTYHWGAASSHLPVLYSSTRGDAIHCPSSSPRLEEFVKTPASALTQGEFESEELDDLQSENPPAFQRAEASRKENAIVLMIENGKTPSSSDPMTIKHIVCLRG